MKKTRILMLLLMAFDASAETKIVQPDLELGHWLVTVDNSSMQDGMRASLPAGNADASEMRKQLMPEESTVSLCITPEFFSDFGRLPVDDDCEMDVLENTQIKTFVISRCPKATTYITRDFISTKYYESTIITKTSSAEGSHKVTVKSTAEWQAPDCPSEKSASSNNVVTRELNQQTQRQKGRVKSRVKRAEDRAVDKGVDKVVDKLFGFFK